MEDNMQFVQLTKEEFNTFSLQYKDTHLWQSTSMAELREQSGFKSAYVGVKINHAIVCATYLSYRVVKFNYRQYVAPRGFLIDYNDTVLFHFFTTALKQYLKQKKALYLSCDPYIPYQEHALDGSVVENGFHNKDIVQSFIQAGFTHKGFTKGIDLAVEPRWIYTIPLGEDEQTLLQSFERKCKRSVMKTIKYKIHTKELTLHTLDEFIAVMNHTSKRRDFDNRSNEYYTRLYNSFVVNGHAKFLSAVMKIDDYIESVQQDRAQELKTVADCDAKLANNPNSAKINSKRNIALDVISRYDKHIADAQKLQQEKGNEIVLSSGVFFTYGSEILCLFSGVYEKYMQFASPYAMHWQMMKYGIKHGYKRYNLYGISGIFDKSAEDYGVYEFKKGFHGEVIELVGVFEIVLSKWMYRLYKLFKK